MIPFLFGLLFPSVFLFPLFLVRHSYYPLVIVHCHWRSIKVQIMRASPCMRSSVQLCSIWVTASVSYCDSSRGQYYSSCPGILKMRYARLNWDPRSGWPLEFVAWICRHFWYCLLVWSRGCKYCDQTLRCNLVLQWHLSDVRLQYSCKAIHIALRMDIVQTLWEYIHTIHRYIYMCM